MNNGKKGSYTTAFCIFNSYHTHLYIMSIRTKSSMELKRITRKRDSVFYVTLKSYMQAKLEHQLKMKHTRIET